MWWTCWRPAESWSVTGFPRSWKPRRIGWASAMTLSSPCAGRRAPAPDESRSWRRRVFRLRLIVHPRHEPLPGRHVPVDLADQVAVGSHEEVDPVDLAARRPPVQVRLAHILDRLDTVGLPPPGEYYRAGPAGAAGAGGGT